jgi:hypothetical protein
MRFAITRRGVALAEIEEPAGSVHGYDIEGPGKVVGNVSHRLHAARVTHQPRELLGRGTDQHRSRRISLPSTRDLTRRNA